MPEPWHDADHDVISPQPNPLRPLSALHSPAVWPSPSTCTARRLPLCPLTATLSNGQPRDNSRPPALRPRHPWSHHPCQNHYHYHFSVSRPRPNNHHSSPAHHPTTTTLRRQYLLLPSQGSLFDPLPADRSSRHHSCHCYSFSCCCCRRFLELVSSRRIAYPCFSPSPQCAEPLLHDRLMRQCFAVSIVPFTRCTVTFIVRVIPSLSNH